MLLTDDAHQPVMISEVLDVMQPENGAVYLDATFGAGGYSRGLLQKANCEIYAIDRDPATEIFAAELAKKFPERFYFIEGCFSQMVNLLAARGVYSVDGIVMDLGVSSMQLDDAKRGFSFMRDGPLDMRQGRDGITAAKVVNEFSEQELADIFYIYGEERRARQIARAVVRERAKQPIESTLQLADIISNVVSGGQNIHPATRSFQALRIYVNRELDELEEALNSSIKMLKCRAKLIVVTFHSLEDRLVKHFLRKYSGMRDAGSRHMPMIDNDDPVYFDLPEKKPRLPTDEEVEYNPRARSAKLRWAIRISSNSKDNKEVVRDATGS